ncbi:MAG: UvrD-helicase domain-containing protein [Chlorobi bacterium]|nr:UvrD-helicase domain-containing protein [Chlorobiota bacterium]
MAFVVYKSSAGSGKTATLVREYLKLCIPLPSEFKRTLAITFTNKAANEMKTRILETLELAAGGDENFLIKDLKQQLGLKDDVFALKSKQLLNSITHNYDEFAVSTIDSFVHRIIRTFANEVDLPSNFEAVLDSDDIVPDIVDELLERVGRDKQLTSILLSFVLKQIEDEKTHNIRIVLNDFVEYNLGEDVFSQKEFLSKLKLQDFPPLIKSLRKARKTLGAQIVSNARRAIDLFSSVSLVQDDISNKGRGIYGFFSKLVEINDIKKLMPNATSRKTVENDLWVAKKADAAIKNAIDEIKDELRQLYFEIVDMAGKYILINFISSKIYSVALITEIQLLFGDFVERTSKVHISEFNKRISENIAGQPVPFLYERLGFKYKNFLIDEFQDTSVLQWQNLLPLIEESLSNNNFSMIVGDAKQAIYRFRNGEVELFSKLPDLLHNSGSQLDMSRQSLLKSQYEEHQLEFNFRSGKNIVEFNNKFFQGLIGKESNYVKEHYQGLVQKVKKSQQSYVKLQLIEEKDSEEYLKKRNSAVSSYVGSCINAGFKAGDICILCRTKKSITSIATHLISDKYDIVSSESLLVCNSPKVGMLVAFLQMLLKPDEKIYLTDFLLKYSILNNIDGKAGFLSAHENHGKPTYSVVARLFKEAVSPEILLSYSVYEICEFAVRMMGFDKEADLFVQYFLDFVFKTISGGKFTIIEFLEHWEDKKMKTFVETPDNPDAIKLMTTHKSKGLDFKVVIVDLAYNRPKQGKTFWADVSKLNIPKLEKSLIPLTMLSAEIGFDDEYIKENEKERLDFINLVYVSFTRASNALFAIGQDNNKDVFGKLLKGFIRSNENTEAVYELGELIPYVYEDDKEFSRIKLTGIASSDFNKIVKIAPSEEIKWEELASKSPESLGRLVHGMLSEIELASDLDRVLNKYLISGFVTEKDMAMLAGYLKGVVFHPALKQYFSGNALIKNETVIYDGKAKVLRPDRVVLLDGELIVIDYKTGNKDKRHILQIREYAEVFAKMGYDKISCILVYINEEAEIVPVDF